MYIIYLSMNILYLSIRKCHHISQQLTLKLWVENLTYYLHSSVAWISVDRGWLCFWHWNNRQVYLYNRFYMKNCWMLVCGKSCILFYPTCLITIFRTWDVILNPHSIPLPTLCVVIWNGLGAYLVSFWKNLRELIILFQSKWVGI